MRWLPIWRRKRPSSSRTRERFRRRTYDLAAGRCDAEHRKSALTSPVRPEAEQPIDAVEAGRVGQHLLGEALRSLRLGERGNERDRIIGERGSAYRILPIAGAIARGEIAKAGRIRRRVPGAFQRGIREDLR